MTDGAERVFTVTQEQLLELLGDAAKPFAEAAAESRARTRARPGEREEIRVVYQNGAVVEVCGAPRRWKGLLPRRT